MSSEILPRNEYAQRFDHPESLVVQIEETARELFEAHGYDELIRHDAATLEPLAEAGNNLAEQIYTDLLADPVDPHLWHLVGSERALGRYRQADAELNRSLHHKGELPSRVQLKHIAVRLGRRSVTYALQHRYADLTIQNMERTAVLAKLWPKVFNPC